MYSRRSWSHLASFVSVVLITILFFEGICFSQRTQQTQTSLDTLAAEYSLEVPRYKVLEEQVVMTFDKDQFRELVKEVLWLLDPVIPYTEDAVELLMMTAAQESHLGKYLRQTKGPACGVFQIEPATAGDLLKFIERRPDLEERVESFVNCGVHQHDVKFNLRSNLAYSIAMARVFYFRVPTKLPHASDTIGMAEYWKQHYNTYLGRGTVSEARTNYARYC